MFQTLCITPDSLAFDILGSVCFLDLPSGMYKTSLRNYISTVAIWYFHRKLAVVIIDYLHIKMRTSTSGCHLDFTF